MSPLFALNFLLKRQTGCASLFVSIPRVCASTAIGLASFYDIAPPCLRVSRSGRADKKFDSRCVHKTHTAPSHFLLASLVYAHSAAQVRPDAPPRRLGDIIKKSPAYAGLRFIYRTDRAESDGSSARYGSGRNILEAHRHK